MGVLFPAELHGAVPVAQARDLGVVENVTATLEQRQVETEPLPQDTILQDEDMPESKPRNKTAPKSSRGTVV